MAIEIEFNEKDFSFRYTGNHGLKEESDDDEESPSEDSGVILKTLFHEIKDSYMQDQFIYHLMDSFDLYLYEAEGIYSHLLDAKFITYDSLGSIVPTADGIELIKAILK